MWFRRPIGKNLEVMIIPNIYHRHQEMEGREERREFRNSNFSLVTVCALCKMCVWPSSSQMVCQYCTCLDWTMRIQLTLQILCCYMIYHISIVMKIPVLCHFANAYFLNMLSISFAIATIQIFSYVIIRIHEYIGANIKVSYSWKQKISLSVEKIHKSLYAVANKDAPKVQVCMCACVCECVCTDKLLSEYRVRTGLALEQIM